MTLTEVMVLEGRELDAAVSEKVFGDNLRATTPERIGKAAFSGFHASLITEIVFEWNDHEYRFPLKDSRWGYGGADGNDGYGLWYWEHRQGEPWQSDIEKQVDDWREKPLPYSTDWYSAMKVREWARSLKDTQSIEWAGFVKQCAQIRLGLSDFAFAALLKAEPVDFARAALLVSNEAVAAAERQAER